MKIKLLLGGIVAIGAIALGYQWAHFPRVVTNHFTVPCSDQPGVCIGGYTEFVYYEDGATPKVTIQKIVAQNPGLDPFLTTPTEVSLTVMNGGMFIYGPNRTYHKLWMAHDDHYINQYRGFQPS